MDLGTYLQRLLGEKGMTARALSKRAGISYVHLNSILHNQDPRTANPPSPSLGKISDLARALNIPAEKLVLAYQGRDPDEHVPDPTMAYHMLRMLDEYYGRDALQTIFNAYFESID